ncbi:hypothetical protein ABBQ32_000864 [Trebouxia sp. C0010 RCD-2024]
MSTRPLHKLGWRSNPAKVLVSGLLDSTALWKPAVTVWADALDAWLQRLAQEIVQEHTLQALTPANVQASLQLLLRRDAGHCRRATRLRSQRSGGIMV